MNLEEKLTRIQDLWLVIQQAQYSYSELIESEEYKEIQILEEEIHQLGVKMLQSK